MLVQREKLKKSAKHTVTHRREESTWQTLTQNIPIYCLLIFPAFFLFPSHRRPPNEAPASILRDTVLFFPSMDSEHHLFQAKLNPCSWHAFFIILYSPRKMILTIQKPIFSFWFNIWALPSPAPRWTATPTIFPANQLPSLLILVPHFKKMVDDREPTSTQCLFSELKQPQDGDWCSSWAWGGRASRAVGWSGAVGLQRPELKGMPPLKSKRTKPRQQSFGLTNHQPKAK